MPPVSMRKRDQIGAITPPAAPAAAVDKTPAKRQLLQRYVDLAFAKEDQIMTSVKTGTSVGLAVGDYFSLGLATVIGKSIETPAIASVRGVRRVQASEMFTAIRDLGPSQLQALVAAAGQQGEPGFDWLRKQLCSGSGAAAAASAVTKSAAASAAGVASSQALAIAQDIFFDYVADAVFDQAMAFVPFGVGAAKSGVQVAQVTQRIGDLRGKIQVLKTKVV